MRSLRLENMEYSYQFTHAIVRQPAKSIIKGLRTVDIGSPDYAQMMSDHEDYKEALTFAGVEVISLTALDKFPDGQFVEDTALCLPKAAILMRPGAPSRLGEVSEIAPKLRKLFKEVYEIEKPGHAEGGDILVTGKEILIGRSARTNTSGISQLSEIVTPLGHVIREVFTPSEILHFKTDCSLLGPNEILSTERLQSSGCFDGYQVINVADGEEAAANAIRVNDYVIMPEGFPKTKAILENRGYKVKAINNTECAKLDGGMSCLSLRLNLM
jgi:dimethylargininase